MNTTRGFLRTAMLCGVALLAWSPSAHAQVSPEEAVRKIVEQVNEEMKEVDRLLLESSRQKDAARGSGADAERLRELIDRTKDSQGNVVRGIDQLIEELENMAQQQQSQGQGGEGPGQGQGQPQQREGQDPQAREQRQPGTRRETPTPDMVQQPGQQQPGEEPRQGDVAKDGQESRDPGQNRHSGSATEGDTEEMQRAADAERWGDLQKYVPSQYQRAGVPEVPAKYRRLHEAFQRRAHERSGGR